MTLENEKELITAIRKGNKSAFESLFRLQYSSLCLFALMYTKDRDKAEELVQDYFCSFWEKRAKIEVTGSLVAYMKSSIRNKCLNQFRSELVRKNYKETLPDESMLYVEMGVEFEVEEKIEEAYQSLPEMCGKVFKMSRKEGLKYSEISKQLGISVKTVENHVGKALKVFRVHLKDYLTLVALVLSYWI